MRRKLIKQGYSSYTISLPSKWVKSNKLVQGDELDMEISDKSILVSTPSSNEIKKIKADIRGFSPFLLERYIARNYQKGIDELELQIDSDGIQVIQSRINDLMGYTILEHNNDTILIKDVSKEISLDFAQLLRKAFLTLQNMGELFVDSLVNNKTELFDELSKRDSDVNKYTYFCLRYINRFGCPINKPIPNMFFILHMLEDIGDCYKNMGFYIKSKGISNKKEFIRLANGINKLFSHCYGYFYSPSQKEIINIQNQYLDNKNQMESLFRNLKATDITSLIFMKDLNDMCFHVLKNCL